MRRLAPIRRALKTLTSRQLRILAFMIGTSTAAALILLLTPSTPLRVCALVAILSLPAVVATRREDRLMVSLVLGAAILGSFAISSSMWSANTHTRIILKLSDPGKLVLRPISSPEEVHRESGLGCRASAVLADGWRYEDLGPILSWELAPLPGFVMTQDGEYQPLGLITIGPREWLDSVAPAPIPFLIEPKRDSEHSQHLQTRIRLPAAGDEHSGEYIWSWDPASLVGWAGQLDWQSDQLSCICDYQGVASHAIPANTEVVLDVSSGPVAIIPTEPRSFWLDHPSANGIGEISVATLASESPRILDSFYDRSRRFVSDEIRPVADVWRELSTDASKIVLSNKRVRMNEGPFLLLGEQAELRIDGEIVAAFDSSFFAIVEPWTPHGEFIFDSPVVSFLALNDDWACDCPLLWLYGKAFNERGNVSVTIMNSLGELKVGENDYQFEEHDIVSLELTPVSISNRRLHPSEYVLAGEAKAITINGERLTDSTRWDQLPTPVQQILLMFLGASLTGAIGVLIARSRRAPSA